MDWEVSELENSKNFKVLNFSISITGNEWTSIKPTEKYDKDRIDMRLNDPWTYTVNNKIWESRKLPCAFVFKKQKFYKRSGYPYFEIFGYCNDKFCSQPIHGKCIAPDDVGVTIGIECRDTRGIPHKKKKALQGKVRADIKKILEAVKPSKFKSIKVGDLLNNSGGDCPLLQNEAVFSTARQESRDNFIGIKKYPGDEITSLLSMKDEIPSIRRLSTHPFFVWYWTDQLELWKEAANLGAFVSIDASGSFVTSPCIFNDIKSPPIFFITL